MSLTKNCDYGKYSLLANGLTLLRIESLYEQIKIIGEKFDQLVLSRKKDDAAYNRALIKNFVMIPEVRAAFGNEDLLEKVKAECGIRSPVFLGPAVSHFTSHDSTGRSFGLPMHQDFPSMGSSSSSLVIWFALSDCNASSHSLRFLPIGSRKLLPGTQTENGYVLKDKYQFHSDIKVLNVSYGDVAVFSSFCPHATYVNPDFDGWKLSISQRVDDFCDQEWLDAGLPSAYSNSVNRSLYLERLKNLGFSD